MTAYGIGATMTYAIKPEEHLRNVNVLRRLLTSNHFKLRTVHLDELYN
jgi:hypothetical protein